MIPMQLGVGGEKIVRVFRNLQSFRNILREHDPEHIEHIVIDQVVLEEFQLESETTNVIELLLIIHIHAKHLELIPFGENKLLSGLQKRCMLVGIVIIAVALVPSLVTFELSEANTRCSNPNDFAIDGDSLVDLGRLLR